MQWITDLTKDLESQQVGNGGVRKKKRRQQHSKDHGHGQSTLEDQKLPQSRTAGGYKRN